MMIPWEVICCGDTGWFYKLDYNSFKKLLNDSGLHEMVLRITLQVCSPCTISDHRNIETSKPADLRTINVVLKTGSQIGRSGNVIITPQTYVR